MLTQFPLKKSRKEMNQENYTVIWVWPCGPEHQPPSVHYVTALQINVKKILCYFFSCSSALVWGSSVKHQPQKVGKDHILNDEDVVQIVKKVWTLKTRRVVWHINVPVQYVSKFWKSNNFDMRFSWQWLKITIVFSVGRPCSLVGGYQLLDAAFIFHIQEYFQTWR
jgi:hypothetical protein